MAPVNVRFESGDCFEFNWNRHGETLLVPFEVAPGVVIPPGPDDFTAGEIFRWRLQEHTLALYFTIDVVREGPARRVTGDSSADFTSEFLKSRHAVHLPS
jgi:hypothetical protein